MPKSTISEPPKTLVITRVKRSPSRIVIDYDKGADSHCEKSRDNPLPDFILSLDALIPLVCTICELPENYGANLKVLGVTMGTQGGADTVQIVAQKSLSQAGKLLPIVTPPRLLAHPTQEGSYTEPLTTKDADLVHEVIEQAKAYVKGERAQGQLPLGEEEEEETTEGEDTPDNVEHLPGLNGSPAEAEEPEHAEKPKRARKSRSAAAK
jgi:hypothetical protein